MSVMNQVEKAEARVAVVVDANNVVHHTAAVVAPRRCQRLPAASPTNKNRSCRRLSALAEAETTIRSGPHYYCCAHCTPRRGSSSSSSSACRCLCRCISASMSMSAAETSSHCSMSMSPMDGRAGKMFTRAYSAQAGTHGGTREGTEEGRRRRESVAGRGRGCRHTAAAGASLASPLGMIHR